jgi:membrane glycosyltransferase
MDSHRPARQTAVRGLLIALTVVITVSLTFVLGRIVTLDGFGVLDAAFLALFAILTVWISFNSMMAVLGVLSLWRRELSGKAGVISATRFENLSETGHGNFKTAVLIPIYNEDVNRVYAGSLAMRKSLQSLFNRLPAMQIDFFILSDTTNPDVWALEELAFVSQNPQVATLPPIFYRHRLKNINRKVGNIQEFCERWGSAYKYMVVLDADSLMGPETILEMIHRIDADPKIGLLQTPPSPVNSTSLFSRMQQFACSVYGPGCTHGLNLWAGTSGNYWGHNAIIRTEAFLKTCGLPELPGYAPFGGGIMSHDFVEAAFLRKGGWKVVLADDLGQSYEELPCTLTAYLQRDQRWCQGNMQHINFLAHTRLLPMSRFHLTAGIMSFLASPLWGLFMVLGIVQYVFLHRDEMVHTPGIHVMRDSLAVFGVTLGMIFLPKVLTMVRVLSSNRLSHQHGGRIRFVLSVLSEWVISVFTAPIMLYFHSTFVVSNIFGRKVSWNAQKRGDDALEWNDAIVTYAPLMFLGIIAGTAIRLLDYHMFLWFSPVLAGLVFAIPSAYILSSTGIGKRLRQWKIFTIPEELNPPAVLKLQHQYLDDVLTSTGEAALDAFELIIKNRQAYTRHQIALSSSNQSELNSMKAQKISEHDMMLWKARIISNHMLDFTAAERKLILCHQEVLQQLHFYYLKKRYQSKFNES